jgi:hypothetical protein
MKVRVNYFTLIRSVQLICFIFSQTDPVRLPGPIYLFWFGSFPFCSMKLIRCVWNLYRHRISLSDSMASTYRDRTSEFRSLTETLKKIGGGEGGATAPPNQQPSTSQNSYSRSEFNRKASQIGLGIHETSQKIARLAKCKAISSSFYIYIYWIELNWLNFVFMICYWLL